MNQPSLPHHRLAAYQLSLEFLRVVHAANVRDAEQRNQARKSAKSAARNIAEAAGRWTRADKARVYAIARGEVCEACAAVEIAAVIGCATAEDVAVVNAIGKRLSDMLGRLAD